MLKYIKILMNKNNNMDTEKGRSDERIRRIMLGSIMAIFHKGLTMLTPLITIGITFSYLGQEVYGLWTAITTFFTLFAFADLGLGNGLQTELSQSSGKKDFDIEAQKIISSAFTMLILVSTAILFVFLFTYPHVNWISLVNATSTTTKELTPFVVLAIFIPRVLNIPLSLVQRTQLALQDAYNSYIWQIVGSILSLISIIFIAKFDLGELFLIFISSIIPVFISLLNLLYYFTFIRRDLKPTFKKYDKSIMIRLLKTGVSFLGLSVLTTVGLSLDNFIVAKVISLEESAIYSILFKIIHMISTLSTLVTSLLWGANGEAMARGEFEWVKRTNKKVSLMALFVSSIATLLILIFIKPITSMLVGSSVHFSLFLVLGMCLLEVLISVVSPYFMILNASNNIRIQIALFLFYTPLSFILKFYLAGIYGITFVPWIAVALYSVIIAPWIVLRGRNIINEGIRKGMVK